MTLIPESNHDAGGCLRCAAGAELFGPAVIEQEDSTVLVPPNGMAVTDVNGNILITRFGT